MFLPVREESLAVSDVSVGVLWLLSSYTDTWLGSILTFFSSAREDSLSAASDSDNSDWDLIEWPSVVMVEVSLTRFVSDFGLLGAGIGLACLDFDTVLTW